MKTENVEINGVVSLAAGMVDDAHQLVQQQIELTKAEIRAEVAKLKAAVLARALSTVVIFLGCLLIPFLLADLMLYLTDDAIPVWGAYAIVSLSLISVGLLFFAAANKKQEIEEAVS
jgi:precorrin-4 methylase